MANYSLVLNTKFDPFTFEEMFRPALMATQAQAAAEEQYQKLMEQAVQWGNKANEQTDPVAYNRYKNYADQLANYADKLSRYGLSVADRQGIMEMRTRYAKEITPIQEAIMRREKDKAAQQQILMQDPTHIFGKNAATTSLDEYLQNPNLDVLSNHYSGALAAQQVGAAAKAVAEEAREAMLEPAGHMMLKFTQKYGYSPSQVLAAINNPRDPNASPILRGILGSVMDSTGAAEWASKADFDRLLQYASQGLWQAIGKNQIQMVEDKEAVLAKQHEYSMAQLAAQHDYEMEKLQAQWDHEAELAAIKAGANGDKALEAALNGLQPVNYFNAVENKETSKYFTKNGKIGKNYVLDVKKLNEAIRTAGKNPSEVLPMLLSAYKTGGEDAATRVLAQLMPDLRDPMALTGNRWADGVLYNIPLLGSGLMVDAIGGNTMYNQFSKAKDLVKVLPILDAVSNSKGSKLYASKTNSYKGYKDGDILPHVNTVNSFADNKKLKAPRYIDYNTGYDITLDSSMGEQVFEKLRVGVGQNGIRVGKLGATGQFVPTDSISKEDIDTWSDAKITTLHILPSGEVTLELKKSTKGEKGGTTKTYYVALDVPSYSRQFASAISNLNKFKQMSLDATQSEETRAQATRLFYEEYANIYKYILNNLGASVKASPTDVTKLLGNDKDSNDEDNNN